MLSCGGAPFSVTFSIVFDRSFSGSRFRSVVFDEDNTASAAAAAAGGLTTLMFSAAVQFFSQSVEQP